MAPEYVAIIVTISVLGGVIIIALVAVCVAKCAANRRLKRNGAETQLFGDTVALYNANGPPSFVRYPAPEPYTPAPHDPEDIPWRFSYANKPPVPEENNANIVDTPDRTMFPDLPGPHDMSRRPSHVQDPPRRFSYAQDLPRRSSQVQDLPRRSSYAYGMPRRSSYAPYMIRRPSTNRSAQEPPSGHQKKLWYNYLKEEPNYYTKEALEWNRKPPRVWPAEESKSSPSPPPRYEASQQHHQHAASRSSWI